MTRVPGEPVVLPSAAGSPGPRLGATRPGYPQVAVHITVPGVPIGKGRPKFFIRRNPGKGRLIGATTPTRTVNFEAVLALHGSQAMAGRAPLDGALKVVIKAFMPIASSWSRKKLQAALAGEIRPGKPDLDNIMKTLDALNGICFRDDAQVAEATISKRYDLRPRLEIEVSVIS